jgi:hypothetical protein
MNFNNVVSGIAASDLSGQEYKAVKLTSAGIDLAGATDTPIGVLVTGAAAGKAVDVFLKRGGLHEVVLGSDTAVASGDLLDLHAGGTFVEHANGGTPAAIAWDAAPAGSTGGRIHVVLL